MNFEKMLSDLGKGLAHIGKSILNHVGSLVEGIGSLLFNVINTILHPIDFIKRHKLAVLVVTLCVLAGIALAIAMPYLLPGLVAAVAGGFGAIPLVGGTLAGLITAGGSWLVSGLFVAGAIAAAGIAYKAVELFIRGVVAFQEWGNETLPENIVPEEVIDPARVGDMKRIGHTNSAGLYQDLKTNKTYLVTPAPVHQVGGPNSTDFAYFDRKSKVMGPAFDADGNAIPVVQVGRGKDKVVQIEEAERAQFQAQF